MFETVGSGSSSSDSFVNISHSGASSISISTASTTSNNNGKLTTQDKLRTEITKLREDNKVLKDRIRGVKTLSDLLSECRKENEQLKAQLSALTMSMQAVESPTSGTGVASPFSLVSQQSAAQQRQRAGVTQQPTVEEHRPPSSLSPSLQRLALDTKQPPPPISHPPVSGPPASLQETVCPPGQLSKETKLISLTSPTDTQHKPDQSTKQDAAKPEPATTKVSYPPGPESLAASDMSTPELLQLDSDKYDEATYEKVGLQLGLGQVGLSGSMYAAGGTSGGGGSGGSNRAAESRPIDFPSLSSENSTCLTQPHSHSSAINPPYMAVMQQQSMIGSGPGGISRAGGMDLTSQLENMSERLNSGPGDSIAAMASHMHQMAERISRTEKKDRDQRKLIDTLMCENQDLKRLMKAAESMHKEEVATLREENSRLAQQLQSQRPHDSREPARTSASPSQGDWVHVKQSGAETPDDTDHSLVDRVRVLEQEKAELLRANMNWKRQWDHLEQGHQVKVTELRAKLAQAEQELSAHRVRLAEQTSEFESRMLEIKRRITDEENLKEEAQHQQRLAERQCSELQEQLSEMRTQLSDTARQRQALATELSVLKANRAEQGANQQSGAANTSSARSSLEAENTMLKEQLKVFAEDFEQERLDRTTAQASRDAAKKTAEQIGRQNHTMSTQIKHLQKQIKDRDDTISWTLRQNENLQRQAADYKKKLAGEWEEKESLKRRVLLLEQQLQQSPRRNPYLSNNSEPILTYHNPLPVHQPPPPPARYYGGQGVGGGGGGSGAQAAARARTSTLSPEHLPGAWTCQACTYINYPGRTVCESCGCINNPRAGGYPDQLGFNSHDMYGSEHALLMSRGGEQAQNGVIPPSSGDLVVDSGQWAPIPN